MSSGNLNTLLDEHVSTLFDEGKFDDALRVAGTALRNARQAAEEDEGNQMLLLNALEGLADLHRQVGDFEKAESLYQEGIETADRIGAPLERLAQVRSGLATLYDFNQREEAAIPLYEQAITDYEKMTPPRDQDAAQLRNNLAMIYKSLSKFSLAEQHYLMSLETLEKIYGRNNERVAAVFNNLGSLYYSAGFAEQAKEMHEEALDIRVKVFGPEHPEVAQSYCNLATACYELQDDEGAQRNYERSLRILELHLDTAADSYEQVAGDYVALLGAIGEDKKAQALSRRVEKILKK